MMAARQQQPQRRRRRWQQRGVAPPQQHRLRPPLLLLLAVLLVLLAPVGAVLPSKRPGNVLTMILTDCAKYQDWQTIAAAFAWRQSEQPGRVVRVANCNEKDTAAYDKHMLDYVDTHMAKQYAWYEPLKDWYAAYNKPGAVVDYFEHFPNPPEDWVVVLDSDMLLKRPFLPEELPLERGWAYAAHYDYLIGTDNALSRRHVPEVPPRNDTLAGHKGRRGDRVGGPYYMHRDDLKRLAPQWLNYTHIMRDDMQAYQDSGDTASKKGDRIWIAEMYGYSFGAAKSNVWHKWKPDFMLYPSYTPDAGVPHVLHYGLIYRVGDWQYDKHWYFDFDVHTCPPWPVGADKPKAGLFPPPPYPDQLRNKEYLSHYRDLLAVSVISVVNAAMCDYHVRNCPPSPQLTAVCDEAFKLYHAIDTQIKDYEWRWACTDHNKECPMWAARGECEKSKQYMIDHCQVSCKYCTPPGPRPKSQAELHPLSVAAISKEVGVTPAPAGSSSSSGTGGSGDASATAAAAAAAVAAEAAKHYAAARAEAAKAAADKAAAAQKPAAGATLGAAAAGSSSSSPAAAAAAAAAEGMLSEAQMRSKYATTTLTYSALVKRCSDLQGLSDGELRSCLKAASYKLVYPGTLKAGSTSSSGGQRLVQQGLAGGAAVQPGSAQDLAALAAQHTGISKSSVQNYMLGRSAVAQGSWSVAQQAFLGVALLGVCVLCYTRWERWRLSRAKAHSRSE